MLDPNQHTPRQNSTCPVCGTPNGCAPALSGTFDTDCWCRDASIAPAAIAQIPESQRNQACICRRCAEVDQ